MKFKAEDYIGHKFGDWVVVSYTGIIRRRKFYVLCKCRCGREKEVCLNNLISHYSTQCPNCASKNYKHNLRHGMYGTPEYTCWTSLKQRCTNPNSKDYKDYGGRGITVCDRWLHSFKNFFADMGFRPEGMSIDRIDNDKGYSKENCKWSTQSEQNKNRRTLWKKVA